MFFYTVLIVYLILDNIHCSFGQQISQPNLYLEPTIREVVYHAVITILCSISIYR